MALRQGKKHPAHNSARLSLLKDPFQIEAAMDAGLNVGAVTHQKDLPGINPLGFWDLDIDGPEHGLDLSPFSYRVRRQGESVKAHYLARLPNPAVPIRTALKGRDYDLCTWNTVLPGSIHESGTVYELEYIEDGDWVPWDGEPFSIEMLSIVDPDMYRASAPTKRREHCPSPVQASETPHRFRGEPKKTPVWIAATGSHETRIKMAKHYLRFIAWASVSGKNGHTSLLVAVTNLRLFHCLPECLTLSMVKKHFNPRCRDLQGNHCAWSDAEIMHKWQEAGKPSAYPTLGVRNPKARRKRAMELLHREVAKFIGQFTKPGGSTNPTSLRETFIAYRGGVDVNATAFGRAVFRVTNKRTTSPNGVRGYQGFHLTEAGLGFTRSGCGDSLVA